MSKHQRPHNQPSTNADNSIQAAKELLPLLDVAEGGYSAHGEGEGAVARLPSPSAAPSRISFTPEGGFDPFSPVTGSEREAADRALLEAEEARLRQISEALYRETRRSKWGWEAVSINFPIVRPCHLVQIDHEKIAEQVEEEFAELKRKQREDKAD